MSEALGDLSRVREVFDAETIARRVAELGEELSAHYPTGELLMLGALKGSFIFLADLVRHISRPLEVEFLVASSYGRSKTSSGQVRLHYDPATPLVGRHVVLVEDIIDSGRTLNSLVRLLETRDPASLEICALLRKRNAALTLEPRFVGFDAPDEFLVGYGLDYDQQYRHLGFVGSLIEDQ